MSTADVVAPWRRQSNQIPERGSQTQTQRQNDSCSVPANSERVPTPTPPPAPASCTVPPAPPPPPPPSLNGGTIPSIRLQSEISDRNQPPAKIQSAMTKDKKPFTYTPGGIDLSEIKSPSMQRRMIRNAQEPEDIVLPPSSSPVNAHSLPPSTVAAMTPQIAIPVFPQNNAADKRVCTQRLNANVPPPPPPRAPSPIPKTATTTPKAPNPPPVPQKHGPHPTVSSPPVSQTPSMPSDTNSQNFSSPKDTKPKTGTHVGSLYVPPVTNNESSKSKQQSSSPPAFPTLREAPTPWLQRHQQTPPENVPFWANRGNQNGNSNESKDVQPERKPRFVQVNKETGYEKPTSNGHAHIVPVQIEGATQTTNQPKTRPNQQQRWGNNRDDQTIQSNVNNNRITTRQNSETDTKPIQSRSFKVLQKITGSEDDATDSNSNALYNTEGVPLSQLKKLQLNDDDRAFMNKVKAQVDEDTFLHMETDPRYRGSVIPSRAFRMLQNMTDSGQVTSNNNNVTTIPITNTNISSGNRTQTHPTQNTIEVQTRIQEKPAVGTRTVVAEKAAENETKRTYIPPSERQAEQELRKYMGSSIPSRSFRMLQAMTATQDPVGRADETDF